MIFVSFPSGNEENLTVDADQNKRKRCSTSKSEHNSLRVLDASSDSNCVLDSGRQKHDSTSVADGLKIRLRKIATRSSGKISFPPNKDRICMICDKSFVTKNNRDKHMANFHKENRKNDANESISTGEGDQNQCIESSMGEAQGALIEKSMCLL